MITKLGSARWVENQYNLRTGGINLDNLKNPGKGLNYSRIPNDADIVKVTISEEAKSLYESMVKANEGSND
jgi:hypothetical protein